MSFLAPILIRTLGPTVALACAGALLAPLMSQPSRVYPTTDVVQLIGGQIWPTLLLIALAIVFATAIWLPLAVLTARRGYHAGLTVAPVSVLAQAMAPRADATMLPPGSAGHAFGTDPLGRDML